MIKAEDLTGREFGYLKALYRTDDRISKSGQKKVRWMCECQLCGTKKVVNAQDLKRGSTISCGCYQAVRGAENRNKKICVVCGKTFECPPSDKTVTCSNECRRINARNRRIGKKLPGETRKKMSASAQGRDMTDLQAAGTAAAQISPKSGRFKTNVNAVDWHLISPEGKHYYFHSLNFWLRENGLDLFGCEPDSREFNNVRSGLSNAKRAALGKKYPCCTYKGWKVIPTGYDNNEINP